MDVSLKVLVVNLEVGTTYPIVSNLHELGFNKIAIEHNLVAAISSVQHNKPDFVLINTCTVSAGEGIETGRLLNEEFQIPFMYITPDLHKDLLQQIIDTKPCAYVMKPMSKSRFIIGLNILLSRVSNTRQTFLWERKYGGKKVAENDIIYFQASGNYWEVITYTSKALLRRNVNELMAELRENEYIRIHRSYIVKLEAIQEFFDSKVCLINGLTLPISRRFQHNLKKIN